MKNSFFAVVLVMAFLFATNCQAQGDWVQKNSFGGTGRARAVAFSIGTKGYIGTGSDGSPTKDFWEWDQSTNTWTQKADFGGPARSAAVGFSIGTKGYIGTGTSANIVTGSGGEDFKDFWEWNQATNTWTQKADFGGGLTDWAVGFSIGTKGYIGTGTGNSNSYQNVFWEWDQTTNNWTKKADFPGGPRGAAVGFSIGTKGYIGTGTPDGFSYTKDFWEWNQATNTWTQKNDFGGGYRLDDVGFSIGNLGFIGMGDQSGNHLSDLWQYDPTTGIWSQEASMPGTPRWSPIGFSIGSKGYVGTGTSNYYTVFLSDFWEFTGQTPCSYTKAPAKPASITGPSTNVCGGNSYTFSCATMANTTAYNWTIPTGALISCCQGTTTISVKMPAGFTNGSVKVNASNCFGASKDRSITVYGIPKKPGTITGPVSICANQTNAHYSIASVTGASSYTWTVPTGASITNGQGTTTITVNYGANGGTIKVSAGSTCGTSGKKSLTVSITCRDEYSARDTNMPLSVYPNPIADVATVNFRLNQSSQVSIKVYDISGKEIETLVNNNLEQGDHFLQFNNNNIPKGVYFMRMTTKDGVENVKLILQ